MSQASLPWEIHSQVKIWLNAAGPSHRVTPADLSSQPPFSCRCSRACGDGQRDTGQTQLMGWALLPCSSPKKPQKVNLVHLLAACACWVLQVANARVINVKGIISSENAPLKLHLISIREDWRCHLFPKYSLIWISTVLSTFLLGFPHSIIKILKANVIFPSLCL